LCRADKQQRKSKQPNTHARNNKINEGKQHRKNTIANMQSVTTGKKPAKQIVSGILKLKYPTHLKMAMSEN
jgi:TnpA family transposase